ncbi:hypothetical protein PSDVSF_32610 [Pseudodesulfovibrio sediminis]|uniref:histidine kinase n=2 Tax=Pseudodesulfovibrio sediminis TaxID=2810563 RepID=A0ABM7PAF6_9BACT|nr:hypothetical protein PSDVSF_32610 [Pseudodesulfovibrio sediminis]
MKGRLSYANTFALDTYGFSQQDLAEGLHVLDTMHPDSRKIARVNIANVLQGNDDMGAEYRGVRKDGNEFPIKVYSKRIMDDGKIMGLRGVVIDLSPVRTVESALEKTENYYQTLFENTGTAMVIVQKDSIIKNCNSQFEALAGYTAEDIEGKMRWSDFVAPSDLARMKAINKKRLQKNEEAPTNYEFTFLTKNNELKQVNLFVRVIPNTDDRICSLIDITAKDDALTALRISEERYELVTRGANDGVWDWNLKTDEVWYSARYKEIIGYSDTEFPNTSEAWKNAIHPDDVQHTLNANMTCVTGEVESFEVEYRMFHKDGSIRWILGRGGSSKDEEGNVIRLAGTHTDITDRKQVEQALRESEETYRELIEQASSGIYKCTPEGRFISVNSAMARILGYDSPEELTNNVNNIGSQIWLNPEDRMAYMKLLEKTNALNDYEKHVRRRDGSYIWTTENVRVVRDGEGEILYYEGFLNDITARKMNERTTHALYAISTAVTEASDLQELYATIHSIIDAVIIANNFFITLYDDKNDSLNFVYFKDEVDDYYNIDNVSDPNKNSLTIQIFRTGSPVFFSKNDSNYNTIIQEIGVLGTLPEVWLGVPLKLGGKVIGAMAVQDYTDSHRYADADIAFMTAVSEQAAMAIQRKTTEEELTLLNEELESKVDKRTAELKAKAAQLEEANERLRELDKIKSSLVSSVSHELRTPLTSIRGFAKLCARDFRRHFQPLSEGDTLIKKSQRISANLDIIDTEGDRLTRLINDFLDINRIESGKASWHDHQLNPNDIIKKAASTVAGGFAANPDIELITKLQETNSCIIADPDKVQQVLINLLHNAYKFTEKGHISISVEEKADYLNFVVTDTGSGISQYELPHIFDKFHKYALGDTIQSEEKGTGLGLTISKEIVEHYGGQIWVKSTLGQGSAFYVAFPTAIVSEKACG